MLWGSNLRSKNPKETFKSLILLKNRVTVITKNKKINSSCKIKTFSSVHSKSKIVGSSSIDHVAFRTNRKKARSVFNFLPFRRALSAAPPDRLLSVFFVFVFLLRSFGRNQNAIRPPPPETWSRHRTACAYTLVVTAVFEYYFASRDDRVKSLECAKTRLVVCVFRRL